MFKKIHAGNSAPIGMKGTMATSRPISTYLVVSLNSVTVGRFSFEIWFRIGHYSVVPRRTSTFSLSLLKKRVPQNRTYRSYI